MNIFSMLVIFPVSIVVICIMGYAIYRLRYSSDGVSDSNFDLGRDSEENPVIDPGEDFISNLIAEVNNDKILEKSIRMP